MKLTWNRLDTLYNQFGLVCSGVIDNFFELEFLVDHTYVLNETRVWIGVNPTTIPQLQNGAPQVELFPFTGEKISLPMNYFDFRFGCDIYILPQATLIPALSASNQTDSIWCYGGDTPFNLNAGFSLLYKSTINCLTSAPTDSPNGISLVTGRKCRNQRGLR